MHHTKNILMTKYSLVTSDLDLIVHTDLRVWNVNCIALAVTVMLPMQELSNVCTVMHLATLGPYGVNFLIKNCLV